jgi:hypothetical protein
MPSVLVGAIKFAITAHKRDMLTPISSEAREAEISNTDRDIAEGEERIARISRLITRLQRMGFDTSVADKLLVTMTGSLTLMHESRRGLASQRWRTPSG